MYVPTIHIHKTVLMQRLQDAVSRAYYWHTSGTIPIHKAQQLAEKFSERYCVHFNDNQRAYARRKGKANARLFLLASSNSTDLTWWLAVTAGTGSIHEQEQLMYALDRRQRVRVDNDYELLRRTRKSTKGGGTIWSWRMTHECYESWRTRIIGACRQRNNAEIRLGLGSLNRVPGFSGTREQVGQLVALARAEWLRRHGSLTDLPTLPKLGYVERLPDTSISLSELQRQMAI